MIFHFIKNKKLISVSFDKILQWQKLSHPKTALKKR
jgi:hypothetical protein